MRRVHRFPAVGHGSQEICRVTKKKKKNSGRASTRDAAVVRWSPRRSGTGGSGQDRHPRSCRAGACRSSSEKGPASTLETPEQRHEGSPSHLGAVKDYIGRQVMTTMMNHWWARPRHPRNEPHGDPVQACLNKAIESRACPIVVVYLSMSSAATCPVTMRQALRSYWMIASP